MLFGTMTIVALSSPPQRIETMMLLFLLREVLNQSQVLPLPSPLQKTLMFKRCDGTATTLQHSTSLKQQECVEKTLSLLKWFQLKTLPSLELISRITLTLHFETLSIVIYLQLDITRRQPVIKCFSVDLMHLINLDIQDNISLERFKHLHR